VVRDPTEPVDIVAHKETPGVVVNGKEIEKPLTGGAVDPGKPVGIQYKARRYNMEEE
jgi:hypothetical protein